MPQSLFDWENDDDRVTQGVPEPKYPPAPWEELNTQEVPHAPLPAEFQPGTLESRAGAEFQPEPFGYHSEPNIYQTQPAEYQPETTEEAIRRGGLAWSAGIVFFGSVAFMLFLGWIADLLLGTAPWGLVGGILVGSVIGFVQFVRTTSQIFNTKKAESAMHPLLPPDDVER